MDRSTDNHESAHFHSDRMYRVNGEWSFFIREGTDVGPFATKEIAERDLALYLAQFKEDE